MKQFVIASVLIILFWVLNIFGIRIIKWFMRVITITPLIITIAVLVGLALIGPNVGYYNWDKVFGVGTAEKIMKVAFEGGDFGGTHVEPLKAVPMWDSTYSMLLWTL